MQCARTARTPCLSLSKKHRPFFLGQKRILTDKLFRLGSRLVLQQLHKPPSSITGIETWEPGVSYTCAEPALSCIFLHASVGSVPVKQVPERRLGCAGSTGGQAMLTRESGSGTAPS